LNEPSASRSRKRREEILALLRKQGRFSIQEIVDAFGVSEATARRDADSLAQLDGVIRTIGGVQLEGYSAAREASFHEKRQVLRAEKEAIAERAVTLVEEGDIVGLSGGTTTFLIARRLKAMRNITVVTNAVNIAMELADGEGIQIVLTGGVMRSNSYELCGPLAEKTVEHLNITKMFLGIDGFTIEQGFTTYSELEAQIGRLMISRAARTIAVFDRSKLDRASLFTIVPLSAVHACITNAPLDDRYREALEKRGIDLHLVGTPT
jgi:DeoR family transcriptional regulator of aga operon